MRKATDIILIDPTSEPELLAGEMVREPAVQIFDGTEVAGNFLNPFSWFKGDAQKTIDNAEQGIAPENTGGLAGKMLERKAKQAEMMRLLGR